MKRIVLIATAVAMLIAAAAAFAATTQVNTYKASFKFNSKSSGTAKKPKKTAFKLNISVTPGTAGDRAGVLLNIKTTLYGVKIDGKHFPTCPASKITSSDTGCPKGAMVASGSIKALLGPPTNPAASAAIGSCNPLLHVWNGGQGKLVFFFVDGAAGTAHACINGGITTGSVPPYPATYKQVGKNLVVNVPIPKSVDYPSGLVGSLQSETLNWKGQSSKGHTSIATVACKGSKRPYSTAFTAAPITGGAAQTVSVKGSAPCKK